MKKRNRLLFVLFAIAFCFMFTSKPADAATTKTIAYINSSQSSFVYKTKEFCSNGYLVNVKNLETGNFVFSKAKVVSVKKSGIKTFTVKFSYQNHTRYQLVITGKGTKNTKRINFYTGTALTKATVAKSSTNTLNCSVTLKSGFIGTGEFRVYNGTNSITMVASAALKETSSTSAFASIPATLANGNYRVYAIMNYNISGTSYAGQGKESTYKFIKTQAQVTGVSATTAGSMVTLTWNPSSTASYYQVYQSTSKSGSYKCVATKIKTARYTTKTVKGGKNYYYKVRAVGVAGTSTVTGKFSAVKSIYVPVTPGKVTGLTLYLDFDENLCLKWSSSANTTGYRVYYKTASGSYKALGTTTNTSMKLSKLDSKTEYTIVVRSYRKASGTVKWADVTSNPVTLTKSTYISKHKTALLARGVRSIGYVGKSRCIYTTRHYSKARKTAFVNYKGYSSKTKYLIWISHYTQQVMIYKGSKGNWKLIRSCVTATGKASTRSPRGVFKVTYKEKGWFYTSTKELYVTHWCSRNSFHTRPLWNDGSVQNATIGRPASHGCARLYNSDAKYIYSNIPKGTTVVSY